MCSTYHIMLYNNKLDFNKISSGLNRIISMVATEKDPITLKSLEPMMKLPLVLEGAIFQSMKVFGQHC